MSDFTQQQRAIVRRAINNAVIHRHEFNLTQATCHKRGCPCRMAGNGDPYAALELVQKTILDHVDTIMLCGEDDDDFE